MLVDTNYNQPCGFADEIVEYIYGEMIGDAKAKFETHLAKCNSCADELSGFGIVRSQVADWKLNEFSPMTTPLIELPLVQTVENTQVKRRWFESLRDLFSPTWKIQTAAFATLAICFGLAFYAFNYQKPISSDEVMPVDEIAKSTPITVPTPPIKVSPTPIVENTESTSKPSINQPTKSTVSTVKMTTPKKVVVQAIQIEPKKTVTPAIPKRGVKPVPTRKQTNVDLTINDVEEDDSLRLSDLFDEVSMK